VPRPIWSGSISFGLVNVPVKLYAATSPKDVRFHQLHAPDGARIQQKRICPADGEEVPWEDVVKGYEVEPGRYVTVTAEELERIAPETTRTIEIEEFVELEDIDPMLYEHSYYLVPDRGAGKAYALLRTAMDDAGKVALGRVVLRTKQYLAAIRATGPALSLSTLVFADEVLPQDDIDGLPDADAEVAPGELKAATTLVESLSEPWDPDRFKDEYRLRVLELIEQKAKGQEIVVQPAAEEEPPDVVDLMAALEASLATARGKDEQKPKARSRKRASGS
jgi:DNA end-binding protein Ku